MTGETLRYIAGGAFTVYQFGVFIMATVSFLETPPEITGKARLFRALARGLAWPWLIYRQVRGKTEP